MASDAANLTAHLAARIRAEGPLTVAAYMEEALFHPRWGYYATRDPLGARGDFVTAPEIVQVFGELIGLWCADLWQRMGAPEPVLLVELGPGRGTLMRDALRAARVAPDFGRALRLHLVERSPVLRAVQATLSADTKPTWHDTLASVPQGPMLLVANEFLDALPIRQFVRGKEGWRERVVALEGNELAFALLPADAKLGDAPLDAVREKRPEAGTLASDVARRLAASGGAALFVDYGYWPPAYGDTLQAVRRHRAHDVLAEPGAADLTAHVDFADFAAAAEEAGARVWGPVPQGVFLERLGIEARAARLIASADAEAAHLIRSGCRRLVDPAEMGGLFKVLALTDPAAPQPAGFA